MLPLSYGFLCFFLFAIFARAGSTAGSMSKPNFTARVAMYLSLEATVLGRTEPKNKHVDQAYQRHVEGSNTRPSTRQEPSRWPLHTPSSIRAIGGCGCYVKRGGGHTSDSICSMSFRRRSCCASIPAR